MTGKFLISAAALLMFLPAAAKTTAFPWPANSFTNPSVERTSTSLVLTMDINPAAFDLKSNREARLRPAVVSGTDTLWFNPVIVAGRIRYNQNLRTRALAEDVIQLHAGSREIYPYQAIVPFQPWMEVCELVLTGVVSGCAGDCMGSLTPDQPLTSCDFREKILDVQYTYVSPTKEISKIYTAEGQAYIDFPVNQAIIDPEYRRNPIELAKIRRTIDELHNDKDVTIQEITFKGYASPEGSYANNERLARRRTEALIEYVRDLYSFPASVMHASWVAEDWEGLERSLLNMDITDKEQILEVVRDKALTPDQKDNTLKTRFPDEYYILLTKIYPTLRRADYFVKYDVRAYDSIEEIAAVMKTAPQKLSLDELYLYAKSLDKQSPEFREVMEVAVRMYPNDPEANLNAATTAVSFGDYDKAREYLGKSGNTPLVTYLEGAIEAKQGNYDTAKELLDKASMQGVAEAAALLEEMRGFGMIK